MKVMCKFDPRKECPPTSYFYNQLKKTLLSAAEDNGVSADDIVSSVRRIAPVLPEHDTRFTSISDTLRNWCSNQPFQ